MKHYWKARLVKGGPFVGVMTFFDGPLVEGEILDRSPRWQAKVRNETTGRIINMGDMVPIDVEGVFLRNINPITESEYQYLCDHAAFATAHAPHLSDASPQSAIDFNKMKAIF